jgi:Arm DNA-binding domain
LVGLAGLLPHTSPHSFMYIEPRGKSLIIRWRVDSKKYHKTLKNHNNPIGWLNAKSVMASIEKDILSGHFDLRPYTNQGKVKKQNINLIASELFTKYASHRLENWDSFHSSKVRFVENFDTMIFAASVSRGHPRNTTKTEDSRSVSTTANSAIYVAIAL